MEKTLARSIIYDFLAKGFLYPDDETWSVFTDPEFKKNLKDAARLISEGAAALTEERMDAGLESLKNTGLSGLLREYEDLFGIHSRRIKVVLNQTEVVQRKAGLPVLTSVHDLSDLIGFYRAFGFEAPGVRPDHFGVELEFMHILTFKEFQAQREGDEEKIDICKKAEKKFFMDYLSNSGPLFAQGLRQATGGGYFNFLAEIFLWFVERESERFQLVFPRAGEDKIACDCVGISMEGAGNAIPGLKGRGCGWDCL